MFALKYLSKKRPQLAAPKKDIPRKKEQVFRDYLEAFNLHASGVAGKKSKDKYAKHFFDTPEREEGASLCGKPGAVDSVECIGANLLRSRY